MFKQVSSLFLAICLVSSQTVWPISKEQYLAPKSTFSKDIWMEDVFLVISDVSDTLVDANDSVVDPELKEVLEELMDFGVMIAPLTGMGRRTVHDYFLNRLGPFRHPDQLVVGVQNGGIIQNIGTDETIHDFSFPSELRPVLYGRVRVILSALLSEIGQPDVEWEFQPKDDQSLKAILYISFKEGHPLDLNMRHYLIQELENRLKMDPEVSPFIREHKTPWTFYVTQNDLVIGAIDKGEAARKIVQYAKSRMKRLGNTVLILGNDGGLRGNDRPMLELKEVDGSPVKTAYVGLHNQEWALGAGVTLTPGESSGPQATLQILKQLLNRIKGRVTVDLVHSIQWTNVEKDYKTLMLETFLRSDFIGRTIYKFYNLSLSDVASPQVEFLGQGNENYVCTLSLKVAESARQKMLEHYRNTDKVKFLVVVPHRNLKSVYRLDSGVAEFLGEKEVQRLIELTEVGAKMEDRGFPLFGVSQEGIFSRELLEGEEVGEVARRISDVRDLEKLLQAISRVQVHFWANVTGRRWIPMVHDDDIIAIKREDGEYKAYLPDLNTPLFSMSPSRLFTEILYLNYELTQIFYEKHFGRHALLRPQDIQLIISRTLEAFLDVLGEGEGVGALYEILGHLGVQRSRLVGVKARGFHLAKFAFRYHIERFLEERNLPLPSLFYERPAPSIRQKLTWKNTTSLIDKLREHIPISAHQAIQGSSLPRPYDDRSLLNGGDSREFQPGFSYKESSKTFQRVSEILLGIRLMSFDEAKDIFPRRTYTYQILEHFSRLGVRKLGFFHLQEILFGLFHDFDLMETIPADWMRLYRLVRRSSDPRIGAAPRKELNLYNKVSNDLGREIVLRVNQDLGKAALLWHANSNIKDVFSFDVYVDDEFGGVLEFSLSADRKTLFIERIRLNKRGRGVGSALIYWVKDFAQVEGIQNIETFEFVHFILVHILAKVFSPIYVREENKWREITLLEAQRLVIENPTGYRLRFKLPQKMEELPLPARLEQFRHLEYFQMAA